MLALLVAGGLWMTLVMATEAAETSPPPRKASFEVTNTFTVKVPENAQVVRMWFAVPQDDPAHRTFGILSWWPPTRSGQRPVEGIR